MFFYKTSIDYLLIHLDEKGFVVAASFDAKKEKSLEISGEIKSALDSYFTGRSLNLSRFVSSQVTGTSFQKKVWEAISDIPYGETRTYKELAKIIGSENASRAFGTACGKNPVALFVPCHRVIRTSGEDFNYSWGKERKKWLLTHESGAFL
jgi:methylated-DNA-[protein]-cysteine S-methyltransferase